MGPPKKTSELSRAERKSKKRQAEDAIPDLPGDNDNDDEQVQLGEAAKSSKKRKRSSDDKDAGVDTEVAERKAAKREKKGKKAEEKGSDANKLVGSEDQGAEEKSSKKEKIKASPSKEEAMPAVVDEDGDAGPKKSKKERKAERRAREGAEGVTKESNQVTTTETEAIPVVGDSVKAENEEQPKKKKNNNNRNRDKKRKAKAEAGGESKAARFIVFIGNLPYSATKESVAKHFASVKPISVRHSTQKENPAKSKGFAFLEFEGYDHMKTCLKLFHHSMFDDGVSPARKLNVELTAGGGGNTQGRKSKIEEKNQKLNEERIRRIQEEERAKFAKAAEGKPDDSGIHPSRRAIVPKA